MKSVKYTAVFLVVVLIPLAACAQMADQAEIKEITKKYDRGLTKPPSFSFLDPSRFNLSHSYSLSFFSGGGVSGSMALYNGTVTYMLAKPLTLTFNLGILHDPSSIWNDKRVGNSAIFLPSGRLDWRPSKNFLMSVGFERVPAYYRGYYLPGGYRYWRE
jgi:hypothetical protein